MNYLVHLYLSDPDPMVRLGNLMGDFVKGRLEDAPYPPAIIRGLRQHRDVDSYSLNSPTVKISKNRIDPSFGYFRGILIDVFYDHFLARNWAQHAAGPLEDFAEDTYRLLEEHDAILPDDLKRVAPRMIQYNWLVSYRQVEVVERALKRIGERLSRKNPLAEGYGELLKNYGELEEDCAHFLKEAKKQLFT
ncbi:MAG: ACP phosphodiesterase [Thermodesulfobacteriota bacterium]